MMKPPNICQRICIAMIMAAMVILSAQGCSIQTPEERATALAAEEAEAAKIAARPHRLEVVSQKLEFGGFQDAFIIRDAESGEEFIVGRDQGDSITIVQIRKNEQR